VACEVALEAAHRLDAGLALGFLAREVGARLGVQAAAGDRDDVQRAVELAVAATVEAMAVVAPGGHRDRCDSSDPCEVWSLAKRSAPGVCPIRIAAQSGPQPVSASSSGRWTRIRARSSRLSASASRVSTSIRLTCWRAMRTLAVCGSARSRRVMRCSWPG
jgi:hypothetical protein